MNVNLIPLKTWIEQQYKSYPETSPKQQKEEEAENLGVGVATIYRWLKAGNVYIEEVGASISGDDAGVIIWKLEKSCFN